MRDNVKKASKRPDLSTSSHKDKIEVDEPTLSPRPISIPRKIKKAEKQRLLEEVISSLCTPTNA
jgi:hypothetical protein